MSFSQDTSRPLQPASFFTQQEISSALSPGTGNKYIDIEGFFESIDRKNGNIIKLCSDVKESVSSMIRVANIFGAKITEKEKWIVILFYIMYKLRLNIELASRQTTTTRVQKPSEEVLTSYQRILDSIHQFFSQTLKIGDFDSYVTYDNIQFNTPPPIFTNKITDENQKKQFINEFQKGFSNQILVTVDGMPVARSVTQAEIENSNNAANAIPTTATFIKGGSRKRGQKKRRKTRRTKSTR
jgi:hypothetical protein